MNLLNKAVIATLPLVPRGIVRRFADRYIAGDTRKDAIELIKKPEDQLYEPPKTGAETYIRIMQERGKI